MELGYSTLQSMRWHCSFMGDKIYEYSRVREGEECYCETSSKASVDWVGCRYANAWTTQCCPGEEPTLACF